MGGTTRDPRAAAVRLHLHRGIGWGVYGTATVAVFVLVLAGTVGNVASGRILMAVVVAAVGLAVTGFLAFVTHAMVVPALTVRASGVSGRMPRGNAVDAGWADITIDVDDEAGSDAITLSVGAESVTVTARSWIGFPEFVVLLGSTPEAAARLTSAARREVARLLGVGG